VGGHGFISENLVDFSDIEQIDDISRTAAFLFDQGITKMYMSYPNGGFNYAIIEIMGKCGFDVAFTTTNRIITDLRAENKLALPRLDAAQKLIVS